MDDLSGEQLNDSVYNGVSDSDWKNNTLKRCRKNAKWNNVKNIQSDFEMTTSESNTFSNIVAFYPNFRTKIIENLTKLSITAPTLIQLQAVPILLKHQNILACSPTGSGKTIAYLLPILQHCYECCQNDTSWMLKPDGVLKYQESSLESRKIQLFAIILVPTRELGHQILSETLRLADGLSESPFITCLSRRHYTSHSSIQKRKNGKVSSLPASIRIVITTPNRIGHLLSDESAHPPFDLSKLRWLVIDECDKMLERDYAVKPSKSCFLEQLKPTFAALRNVQSNIRRIPPINVALFSATIPREVARWAHLDLPSQIGEVEQARDFSLTEVCVGNRNSAPKNVQQDLRYCGTEEGKLLEVRSLLVRGIVFPCIIFMDSRERAEDIVKEIHLFDSCIDVAVMCGRKTPAQRYSTVRSFREGKIGILVCTGLLGRGIDFKCVRMVINYDLPASRDEYIHRVGRTGRAGVRGHAISLWSDADLPHLNDILKIMKKGGCPVDAELERLVSEWELRNSTLASNYEVTQVLKSPIVSKRRGERRLLRRFAANREAYVDPTHGVIATGPNNTSRESKKRLSWFRRWNPYRKSLKSLSNAVQRNRSL